MMFSDTLNSPEYQKFLKEHADATDKAIEINDMEPIVTLCIKDFNESYGHIPLWCWESLLPPLVPRNPWVKD